MLLCSLSVNSFGFEIFALGTSNTNCKNSGQAYTTKLNELLAQDKINAAVINAGVDGDRPAFMMTRLEQGLKANPNIKMVIFEPGPNERNPRFNLGPSEEILAYLQKLNIPTIYVSHSLIQNNEARNLVAQMLSKNPTKRPTLQRILAHPFVSRKPVVRMIGEEAAFDCFISYRVNSDAGHALKLYEMLTSRGITVWLDTKCLQTGVPWEKGFCQGLVNSRSFVSLLSREAINHPTNHRQNFNKLSTTSRCDNVLLEMRMALELGRLGLIEKIYPLRIGDADFEGPGLPAAKYGSYSRGGCAPTFAAPYVDTHVQDVETKLAQYMEAMALGSPLDANKTIKSVVDDILLCQGGKIEGPLESAFETAVNQIVQMVDESKQAQALAAVEACAPQ